MTLLVLRRRGSSASTTTESVLLSGPTPTDTPQSMPGGRYLEPHEFAYIYRYPGADVAGRVVMVLK